MKASREDYAKEELQLAEEEEDLKESFPCDIVKLVEDVEMRISKTLSESEGERKKEGFIHPEPFDVTFNSLPILQQRLPLHLLPTTLYVHDQFHLLQVRDGCFEEHHPQPWSSKPDIVHAYSHNASPAGREKMEKEQEKLISDHEVEEALRKGAKPEEHSSALALYGRPHPWINRTLGIRNARAFLSSQFCRRSPSAPLAFPPGGQRESLFRLSHRVGHPTRPPRPRCPLQTMRHRRRTENYHC
ncbi:uncharacterized protein LACBIDRAFT_296155 [Laccaria bicolor S238N-H82]|uniref:Predicted protein n=1 Tax=Laccaria bicolor (strain S238N-H82 / ATCC MYA-4686) TaxID=486041 RepID=B0E2X6_LACBS|nr:uncharacterized protein LACBIDRAFT_296155 [Laccaria bicolor S238N-H82]EDQ98815.1 predicted protein [Laccaria bicolor S238N-H82]|eukprot:XP_001890545.1 predicted protein [Laccaria bicolor S238N-H82]